MEDQSKRLILTLVLLAVVTKASTMAFLREARSLAPRRALERRDLPNPNARSQNP
jgi:hypothetical protein